MRSVSFPILMSSLLLLFYCQINPVWGRVDTLRAFPQERFVNGGTAFGQHMAKNLRYPLEAMQAGIVGTSLVSITVTPTGKLINVAVINSLGKAIDWEVLRVIRDTKKLWIPADPAAPQDSIMMILPVTFTLENGSGDNDFYVDPVRPDFILSESVVVGYGSPLSIRNDAYYLTQLTEAFQKKEYKQMLKCVNELIRRNPYSDMLYLQRAKIEHQLGQTDEACSDYKKIIYFLGRTHFPKQYLQNCPDLLNQKSSETASARTTEYSPIEEEIFTVCEVPPSFPGGPAALDNYIRQNLRYPEAALKKKGKVVVSFIVTKEGSIQDVYVLKSPGHGTDGEAVRLIQTMPNWNPGKQSGRPVNVKYNLVVPVMVADAK